MKYRIEIYMKSLSAWVAHSNTTDDVVALQEDLDLWRENHPSLQLQMVPDKPKHSNPTPLET